MTEVVERVNLLEEALTKLAYAQFNLHIEIDRLILEGQASRERSEREMADFKAETRVDRRQMNKRWGEIANRLGAIVEDIVLPNIPRIAREHFGAGELEFLGARIRKRHPAEPDRMREFDVIATWPGAVLLNETKGGAMRPEYLTGFAAFIQSGDFFGFFPEYAGRRLIPVFSALALAESDVRYLSREKIYALTMGEETMEIVNRTEIDPSQQG